jgi:hypothetical protein
MRITLASHPKALRLPRPPILQPNHLKAPRPSHVVNLRQLSRGVRTWFSMSTQETSARLITMSQRVEEGTMVPVSNVFLPQRATSTVSTGSQKTWSVFCA